MVQLTAKQILARARANDLSGVKTLNCWGSELTDVSILQDVPNVEVINASVNNIEQLEAFSLCHNLKELYLRRNKIKSINELSHLAELKNLKFLWLSGNPFCSALSDEEYRQAVIQILPQIQKLDNSVVTSSELQKALQHTLESRESDDLKTADDIGEAEHLADDVGEAKHLVPATVTSIEEVVMPQALDRSSSAKPADSESAENSTKSSTSPAKDKKVVNGCGDVDALDISITPPTLPLNPDLRNFNSMKPSTSVSEPPQIAISSSFDSRDFTKQSSLNDTTVSDSLEETNKLRLELGLKPIAVEKYNLSVTQPFKRPKRHKKHATGNNVLTATLHLIDELDISSLLMLQDAVQQRITELDVDGTPEVSINIIPG